MTKVGSYVFTTSAVIMLNGKLPSYPYLLFRCKVIEKSSGYSNLYVIESQDSPIRQLIRYEDEFLTEEQLNNLRGQILSTKINI